MLLKPIESVGSIKMVVTSTYQASSGAGIKGMNELLTQTKQYIEHDELTMDFWNRQYIFNVFPHNSKYDSTTMHNEEELKMINETNKILDKKYEIISTCVRVPTIRSHCLSVNVFFEEEVEYEQIVQAIKSFKGVIFTDDPTYPDAVTTNNNTNVFIGRVRPGINNKKNWNFFISGDQLLKGAGYNTVQILDLMIKCEV
jgi:aspartate-semialdehyde dehydrogenase